jgi:hypothetical protein
MCFPGGWAVTQEESTSGSRWKEDAWQRQEVGRQGSKILKLRRGQYFSQCSLCDWVIEKQPSLALSLHLRWSLGYKMTPVSCESP